MEQQDLYQQSSNGSAISGLYQNIGTKTRLAAVGGLLGLTALVGAACNEDDADVASRNVSKAADNFEINRRVIFYNGITDQYMLNIEGFCSIVSDNIDKQLEVTCKVGEEFDGTPRVKKHFLGLSDNVTYFVEQLEAANVSVNHYRVTFKPQVIIPDIDFRGDADEILDAPRPPENPAGATVPSGQ